MSHSLIRRLAVLTAVVLGVSACTNYDPVSESAPETLPVAETSEPGLVSPRLSTTTTELAVVQQTFGTIGEGSGAEFTPEPRLQWTVFAVHPGDVLNVRAGPDRFSEIVATLDPWTSGLVAERRTVNAEGRWRKIQAPDGTVGWVNTRFITASPAEFNQTQHAGIMRGQVNQMLAWLRNEPEATGPEEWMSPSGIWVGGVGIYGDIGSEFIWQPPMSLRTRAAWSQDREFPPPDDDLELCAALCTKSVESFVGLDQLENTITLNVDDIDPVDGFKEGLMRHAVGVHVVTINEEATSTLELDWQRIHVIFDWTDGTPRIVAMHRWAWTP